MPGFLMNIKNLFTYKPTKAKTFEFLEGENEGAEARTTSRSANQTSKNRSSQNVTNKSEIQNKKRAEALKSPLSINKWNDTKKEEKGAYETQVKGMVDYDLNINLQTVKNELNIPKNKDAIIREFKIARKTNAFLVFIDGMIDKTVINDIILRQLMNPEHFSDFTEGSNIDYILKNVLSINYVMKMNDYQTIIMEVLNGRTALFVEGCAECLIIESRGFEKRNVDKPVTESVIRGPQEGFSENLRTNLTLIRRIIKNKNLVTELIPIGKRNHSNCAILYLDGIVNPKIVNEVKRRIQSLDVDFIHGSGILEQLIEDHPFSIFPQVLDTERPDRAASFIMAGKVVIIAEGSPFVLAVPITFFHMFHTSEDSHIRWQYGTFLRYIRLFGFFAAILLPGLYLALNLYRQELIPTELLAAISESREKVPFPILVELIIMEVSFELIREAAIRVPGIIGNTLGIIGALILGQAAVAANLVSPVLIIVVAVAGIGNFSMPNYSLALGERIARFAFILFGAIAGFYGISIGIFIMAGLICSMKSFGVPFFSPVAPRSKVSHDLFIRQPVWTEKFRPDIENPLDRKKQGKNPRGWAGNGGDKG